MANDTATDVPGWVSLCGSVAPFAALVVILAPFPTIQKILKEQNVRSLPLLPYSSMIANSFLWSTYGLLKSEPKIYLTNLCGLVSGIFYFLTFAKYSPKKAPTLPGSIRQHANVNVMVIAATFFVVFLSPFKDPASIVGNVAVLFCVAMFGSPLAALKVVLKTKSAKSIPLPFTLATVLNCFLWSVFGLLEMKDVNIYFPNLLGLSFGLTQLALKLIYSDGTAGQTESELELML